MKKTASRFLRIMSVASCAVMFLGATQIASAQASGSASASGKAYIVTAISISSNQDLLFGQIVSDTVGGAVTIGNDGTRTSTEPVLLSQSGSLYSTVQQAVFAITGEPGYVYTITLPSSAVTLSGTGSTPPTMTVDTFTSNPTSTGTLDATLGTSTLNVGATLHVGANQTPGLYSGTFSVTVAYQ